MKNLLWLAFLLIGGQALSQQLKGRVVDAVDGAGIPFAKVYIVDVNGALTNETGDFYINGNFPAVMRARISAAGYETTELQIEAGAELLFSLLRSHHDLKEITVVTSSNEMKRNELRNIDLRQVSDLNDVPGVSIGQMLEQIPGVYNASTGIGISKPVIRGLQGVRVLTLVNGVRLEGQQWGGDHGMGISDLGIGSIEVMKGPASLAYGADALGGVIYLGNQAYANQGQHVLSLTSQFESATLGTVNSLLYNGTVKSLKIMAGGRFASHADYQLPNGKFLKNSRFQENQAKLAIGWHRGKWVGNVRYDMSSGTIGIPGHSHELIPSMEEYMSDVQTRRKTLPVQYLTNHIVGIQNKWILKRSTVNFLVGFTYNVLKEHDEKITIPALLLTTLNVPYKLHANTKLGENWQIEYGLQGMVLSQKNGHEAEGRLVPNARQIDNGIFAIATWSKLKWKAMFGARSDIRVSSSSADEKFATAFDKTFVGYNFSAGAMYAGNAGHVYRINVTSGFRTPHLSELLSDGVHHGTFRYEVGNVDLKSEQAIQIDFTYEKQGEHVSFIVNPFVNFITDFIYVDAQNIFHDNIQQFNYMQARGLVTQLGGDLGVHWHPHFAHIIHYESTFSYLKTLSQNNESIALIPQPRWTNAIIARLNMKSKFKVDNVALQYMYYLPQNDVAQYESTSVDYGVLNIGMQMSVNWKSPLQIQVGVKNVTNQSYINHLSRLKTIGIGDVGRSFYLKLIYNLNIK